MRQSHTQQRGQEDRNFECFEDIPGVGGITTVTCVHDFEPRHCYIHLNT